MTTKDYRELMIGVMKMQITDEPTSDYQEGINRGLEIAIDKLEKSAFLTDK